jgi:integrase
LARPKKTIASNLGEAHDLTAGLIERLTCPVDKPQIFLRDTKAPGLRVRVTPASSKNPDGVKAFVFEAKLNRQNIRRTIGDVRSWSIEAARIEANRLRVSLDSGIDPREVDIERQVAAVEKKAAIAAKVEADKLAAITVREIWNIYIEERRPHWGDLHYRDHIDKAKAGGLPSGRRGGGKKLTQPGPLADLMPLALKNLDQPTIEAWAANEGKTRASSARLAWRLLTVFLTWCAEQPDYATLLPPKNPAKTKRTREALGKSGTKKDVLQKGQLAAWFAAVQQLQNPVIAACIQMMLLTGARPGEVLALRWEDVNTQWKGTASSTKWKAPARYRQRPTCCTCWPRCPGEP